MHVLKGVNKNFKIRKNKRFVGLNYKRYFNYFPFCFDLSPIFYFTHFIGGSKLTFLRKEIGLLTFISRNNMYNKITFSISITFLFWKKILKNIN